MLCGVAHRRARRFIVCAFHRAAHALFSPALPPQHNVPEPGRSPDAPPHDDYEPGISCSPDLETLRAAAERHRDALAAVHNFQVWTRHGGVAFAAPVDPRHVVPDLGAVFRFSAGYVSVHRSGAGANGSVPSGNPCNCPARVTLALPGDLVARLLPGQGANLCAAGDARPHLRQRPRAICARQGSCMVDIVVKQGVVY